MFSHCQNSSYDITIQFRPGNTILKNRVYQPVFNSCVRDIVYEGFMISEFWGGYMPKFAGCDPVKPVHRRTNIQFMRHLLALSHQPTAVALQMSKLVILIPRNALEALSDSLTLLELISLLITWST
jgi:hypothetical protein